MIMYMMTQIIKLNLLLHKDNLTKYKIGLNDDLIY